MKIPGFMNKPKEKVSRSKWSKGKQVGSVEAFDRIYTGHHLWFDYGNDTGRVVNAGWARGWQINLLIHLAESGRLFSVVRKLNPARGS